MAGKDRRRVVAVFGHIDREPDQLFAVCLWEERHGTDESRAWSSHLLPRFADGVLPHYGAILLSGKFFKRLHRPQRGYIVHPPHHNPPPTAPPPIFPNPV